jgi:hypothetical protein
MKADLIIHLDVGPDQDLRQTVPQYYKAKANMKTIAATAALLFALLVPNQAQTTGKVTSIPTYAVTDVVFPGFTNTTGTAINHEGDIVGTADGHGFLYHRGKFTDLGPGAANAINVRGQVLGLTSISSSSSTPYLYRNGKFTALPANASTQRFPWHHR